MSPRGKAESHNLKQIFISMAEIIWKHEDFKNTTLKYIASESEFPLEALEQFFESEEALLFAVAMRKLKALNQLIFPPDPTPPPAPQALQLFFDRFYQAYHDDVHGLKIINLALGICKDYVIFPGQRVFKQAFVTYHRFVKKTLVQGQKEGSVKQNINPEHTAHAALFFLSQSLVSLEEKSEYPLYPGPHQLLYRHLVDLFLQAVQTAPPPAGLNCKDFGQNP